jgi:hypothetical protein
MGWGEWLLAGLVVVIFAFVILRPDLWGRRDRRRADGGTAVGVDGTGRRRDDDNDGDSSDGGGGDGGGGGD